MAAMRHWARTGQWPDWFTRVVGDVVPMRYVDRARALQRDLGIIGDDLTKVSPPLPFTSSERRPPQHRRCDVVHLRPLCDQRTRRRVAR